MYEDGDGKNRETFPHIPDEPSKLPDFSPSKLLSFMVIIICVRFGSVSINPVTYSTVVYRDQ